MKNTENAATPISAIVYWRFLPRRRSGSPAQVSCTRDIKPSSVPTRSLNQLRPDSKTAEMRADKERANMHDITDNPTKQELLNLVLARRDAGTLTGKILKKIRKQALALM